MSHLGIRSHVLTLWANNFSVLGLLGAESLVSVAESQDVWGKTQLCHRPSPSVPVPVSYLIPKTGRELPSLPEEPQGLSS